MGKRTWNDDGGGGDGSVRPTGWWILGLAADPAPGDDGAARLLASELRQVAEDAEQIGRGVTSLLQDPAVVGWVGASGEAFRKAGEPFPGQLAALSRSHHDAADALDAYATALVAGQADADSAYRIAHAALSDLGFADDDFRSAAGLDGWDYQNAVGKILLTRDKPDPAPDPLIPHPSQGPDPNKVILGSTAQMSQKASDTLGVMVGAHRSVHAAVAPLQAASRTCAKSVEQAADAAVKAAVWSGAGGPAGGGTFAQRFAAFGGNPADLIFAAQAGGDLQLSELPPSDASPSDVKTWWNGLTPEQRANLMADHPESVGDLDGIPCVTRDQANRMLLARYLTDLTDRRQALLGQEPHPRYFTVAAGGTAVREDNPAWTAWHDQVSALDDQLNGLHAIDNRLKEGPPTPPAFLLGVDTTGLGHAIVAINNPDTADNVVTYVPGTGSRLGKMGGDINRSDLMVQAADAADQQARVTSSITWVGYTAPQNIIKDSPFTHYATEAEGSLHSFEVGLRATHEGAPSLTTVIGHSYGTTAVGYTMRDMGLPVDRVIFVGSPGVGVQHAADLHIDPHHVWVGAAENDPVTYAPPENALSWASNIENNVGDVLGLEHGKGYDHQLAFGRAPQIPQFGAQHLPVTDGKSIWDGGSHSQYWDKGSLSLNSIGIVIAGGDPNG